MLFFISFTTYVALSIDYLYEDCFNWAILSFDLDYLRIDWDGDGIIETLC